MSRRLEKVNETLRHEVSLIVSELSKPEWGIIAITDVKVSPDLRQAKIWVSAPESVINDLQRREHEIREQLRPRLRIKYIPDLLFVRDTGEINHIDELLEKIHES